MVQIIEDIIPISKARPGRKRSGMLGIAIHNTGNTGKGANAKSHAKYLHNNKGNSKSWHYCVDDVCITHSIPDDEISWHAGDGGNGKGNNKTISIEICMNSDGNLTKATDNAAELTAMLLKRYGLGISAVYQHYNFSGKNCPQMLRSGKPYSWNTFLSKVVAFMNGQAGTVSEVKTVDSDIDVIYQTYNATNKWLANITNYNNTDGNGYAGWNGRPIQAIKARLTKGHICYRVHTVNGKWWGWITDRNDVNSNGYAGVLGKNIDMVQIYLKDLPDYDVVYRVHTTNGKWLGWITNYNDIDSNGYAGVKGQSIDMIQIYLVKKVTVTTKVETPVTTAPDNKIIYRVRKSWEDAKSQKGAYSNKESAINLAIQHKMNVYDPTGVCVYKYVEPKPIETPKKEEPKVETPKVETKPVVKEEPKPVETPKKDDTEKKEETPKKEEPKVETKPVVKEDDEDVVDLKETATDDNLSDEQAIKELKKISVWDFLLKILRTLFNIK